jgi:hypothetical protein
MLSNTNDLNWTAYRYVSGEMADGELAAFEQQLADDQQARDAVVNAVKLMDAVAVAESKLDAPMIPSLRYMTWLQRFETHVAMAAALLIAVVFWMSRPAEKNVARLDSTDPAAASADDVRSDVLSVWSDLNSTTDRDDDNAIDVESVAADDAELDVPGWMIAALTPATSNGPDDSEDLQLEN